MRNLPSLSQICVPEIVPAQEIILHVSADNIKKMDKLTQSDPVCIMHVKDQSGNWKEHGRTETIDNTLNPQWVREFKVNYEFEVRQQLRFSVYDVDGDVVLNDRKLIGTCDVDLSEIVLRPETFRIELKKDGQAGRGTFRIDHEESENSAAAQSVVYCQITGTDFDRQHWYRRNRVFFVISRPIEGSTRYIPIYKSPIKKRKLDFYPFQLRYEQLTSSSLDPNTPFRIEFFDSNDFKAPSTIGFLETNFQTMANSNGQKYEIKNSKGEVTGKFRVDGFRKVDLVPFLHFLESGLRLNLMVAIDFTGSNGSPSSSTSLHYISEKHNQYQTSMLSVGEIVSQYCTESKYAAYGFGFDYKCSYKSIFPLSLESDQIYVNGLSGLMDTYANVVRQVYFSGPTNFAPVLKTAMSFCSDNYKKNKSYTVLLIMTDGIITDMYKTSKKIIECSKLPISIIIVGIGNANFDAMEELDADDEPLVVNGKCQCRDLVQFVPFNEILAKPNTTLEKEVLKEIPFQISCWAELNGITPDTYLNNA